MKEHADRGEDLTGGAGLGRRLRDGEGSAFAEARLDGRALTRLLEELERRGGGPAS